MNDKQETRLEHSTESGAVVIAVSVSASHTFSKAAQPLIRLVEGLGAEGDAHAGVTVKHRSRVAADPMQPNLRQIHLIHGELFDELHRAGFDVAPGDLGENVTTRGVDLLSLSTDTLLHIGASAIVQVTGLRKPCVQIDRFQPGLLKELVHRDASGALVRKAGIMGVVLRSGEVRVGDEIRVECPTSPHKPLACI